ncbi:MAG: ABC transporter ATP-binding protein [Chromatiales bacterium]|nr:ABC transporter ATP-binding protein [Chromatiales bacterium]
MRCNVGNDLEPFVQFRGVEKTYDGRVNVVDDLYLDIERGEFLTLLGPSGSGKTTTLMMLAGFEAPTGGEILLAQQSLSTVPAYKRNMGLVFQNYALFPHMSVADNLAYPLRRRGMSKAKIVENLARAVRMVELDGLEDRFPAQLSGGQQQRVALARALIFQPDLVLMDEPLGALDKNLREQMQLEIKHLHAELGMTVVYVTHDQSEALTMSDRVAVFHEGRIQQIDTPQTIYENPVNSFVANFIGENNTLPGTVESVHDDSCIVRLDCGTQVHARAVNIGAQGTRAWVSVRPERLQIDDGATEQTNRLAASVIEVIYFGDHVHLHVESETRKMTVKLPLGTSFDLTPNAPVALSWAPEHCAALDPM